MIAGMTTSKEKTRTTSWGQERRLQFIDFRLRWEARLNRKDIIEHFGVSVPQASLDIAKYLELAPHNLSYDPSSRSYLCSSDFQPLYSLSSAKWYLAELLATKAGILDSDSSFLGSGVAMDFAPVPSREIEDETVVAIVRAIKERRSVLVSYLSMSSSNIPERELSPLALANDGFRWHVRAFCHTRNRFSDFVLARISNIRDIGPSTVSPEQDIEWNTHVTLILIPHPDLPTEKRAVIELDYGMENGEVLMPCRQALLFYTLKHLGLADEDDSSPLAKQISLKNRADVQPYIDALRTRLQRS